MNFRIGLTAAATLAAFATLGRLWWDAHRAEAERVIAINNTRFFQWQSEDGETLTLNVKPNPRLLHTVTAPPVPLSGSVAIRARSGTTPPGAVVHVTNARTHRVVGTYADASGGFSLALTAEAGDDLRILTMPPPRIEEPPQPGYFGIGQ